jgi:hypothetical protein
LKTAQLDQFAGAEMGMSVDDEVEAARASGGEVQVNECVAEQINVVAKLDREVGVDVAAD